MNKNLLAAHMAKHGDTQKDLACAIGICLSRLNAKLNGKENAAFNVKEIGAIVDRYKLKPKEVYEIFFSEKVS